MRPTKNLYHDDAREHGLLCLCSTKLDVDRKFTKKLIIFLFGARIISRDFFLIANIVYSYLCISIYLIISSIIDSLFLMADQSGDQRHDLCSEAHSLSDNPDKESIRMRCA
jgi:hypothetical protein